MKKKLIAVLGLAAAVSMLAGCSAKTISKNPETLLKNARKSLEYVDADASLKVTGKHTGFMRQEADLTYNAEEQYQEVGEVSLLSGTVQMTDGDDSYTDSIHSYVESKNDGSTSYFNFKGAWEYAKTPKLSEMNYLTALLTPENFENLTVSQMRDEGEISVAGPMQGDKLFDAMKTSVSLSDFFVRSSDFRDALRGSEYMVSVYLDSKTGKVKQIQVLAQGNSEDKFKSLQQTIRFVEDSKKPDPDTLKASSDVKEAAKAFGSIGDYTQDPAGGYEDEDVPPMGKISSEAANAEATESEAVSAASTEAAMVSTEKQE